MSYIRKLWSCRDKRPGVGVLRVGKDTTRITFFDDAPTLHDQDPISDCAHDRKIMADKQIGQRMPVA
jgi:hypothetical protein